MYILFAWRFERNKNHDCHLHNYIKTRHRFLIIRLNHSQHDIDAVCIPILRHILTQPTDTSMIVRHFKQKKSAAKYYQYCVTTTTTTTTTKTTTPPPTTYTFQIPIHIFCELTPKGSMSIWELFYKNNINKHRPHSRYTEYTTQTYTITLRRGPSELKKTAVFIFVFNHLWHSVK